MLSECPIEGANPQTLQSPTLTGKELSLAEAEISLNCSTSFSFSPVAFCCCVSMHKLSTRLYYDGFGSMIESVSCDSKCAGHTRYHGSPVQEITGLSAPQPMPQGRLRSPTPSRLLLSPVGLCCPQSLCLCAFLFSKYEQARRCFLHCEICQATGLRCVAM